MTPTETPRRRLDRYLVEMRALVEGMDESEFLSLSRTVGAAKRLFVFGIGRSAEMLRAFADSRGVRGFETHVVFSAGCPRLGKGDLLLMASATGASRVLLAMAEECRSRGGTVGLITANALSPLSRLADHRLTLPPLGPAMPSGGDLIEHLQARFEQTLLLLMDAIQEGLNAPRGGDNGG